MDSASDPGIEILIAEDSRIQARMLEKCLVGAGYSVRAARDGAAALKLVEEKRPTLIISDIEMPEMNGYDFCEAIKRDMELRTIPLILLSTLSEPEDIIRGLHVGADNYVTKPYDADYLLSRVQSLLSTPIGDGGDEETLDVTLAGKRYQVKAGRQQVLNLLVSTFENAVEKNNELVRSNEALSHARDQLEQQNRELESLNDKLETSNTRMSRDLDAAAKIQQSLLPSEMPDFERLDFSWRYVPCDELAGDFLNLFRLDDKHVALFVADVSGHGVASSLLSVTVGRVLTPSVSETSLLVTRDERSGTVQITPPGRVLTELNRRFPMEDQGNLYFTMIYAVLNAETGELRFASAGHPPVVHVPAGKAPQLLATEGFAIGWVDGIDYAEDEASLQLSPGDRIYLYSDGVPEGMDEQLK